MSVVFGTLKTMDPSAVTLIVLLTGLLCAVGGFIFGRFRGTQLERETHRQQTVRLQQEAELRVQQTRLEAESSSREVREDLAAALSRAEELEKYTTQLTKAQAEQQERDRQQQAVLRAMAPMKESITKLEHTLAELEQQRATQHGKLTEQLRSAAQSEQKLRGSAEQLAAALQNTNTRGSWGEMQLRRVVEAAGLARHVDFFEQAQFVTDEGRARPDMVVQLPGQKFLVVDAKTPISDDQSKVLRNHIATLAGRDYPEAIGNSPQLVIAFVPSEALLSRAFDADPELLDFAFSHGVALASPVTLLAVLKSVAHSWQQEVLTQEAERLFELSRELHKRLGTAAGHLEKLGKSITNNVKHYNSLIGSLEVKVFPTARQIAELNADEFYAESQPVHEAIRPLAAPEFTDAQDSAEVDNPLPDADEA
jgi:DNA recombination protein RmuC